MKDKLINLWLKYIRYPKRIRIYRNLLKSDKYFREEDYEYFGRQIFRLRKAIKDL